LKRIFFGIFYILRETRKTKVFIFSIPEPLIFTLPIFFLLRMVGSKVIFIVHDASPHAWSLGSSLRWIERGAHKASYFLASHLVTLSNAAKNSLIKDFNISSDKITVIPHGPLSISDLKSIPGNRKILIFGSLRKNKSVLEVIAGVILARKKGINVQLILAGEPLPQEMEYWSACENMIFENPDGFDLRLGFVQEEMLPKLVCEVDAFVLAYQDFSSQSGVGVLAALAERPVLGTRSGGLGELFDLGMTGCVIPDAVTPIEICSAIEKFYETKISVWRKLAFEGAQNVSQVLKWDAIADSYISLTKKNF
jgi:glycosyltransferase involved in cell wall biosynthesis